MRVPGAAGHQQHRLVLQFAQGIGHMQRVGHDHQARLLAEFGDHRRGGTAAVDDDACVFANPRYRRTGDGLFIRRDWLADIANQFLRHGDCAAIAPQQQAVALQGRQVLTDRNFRSFEAFSQLVHTHFTLFIEQGENIVASLGGVAFRHEHLSFDSKDNGSNQNLLPEIRQAREMKKCCG